MFLNYWSPIVNVLVIVAFIIDRVFRINSIKEYKDAKQAIIEHLKQQLETEKSNNDIVITDMHKKRYESLKLILDEKEAEINQQRQTLLHLQTSIENLTKESEVKILLNKTLLTELNRLERNTHTLENEKKMLLLQVNNINRSANFGSSQSSLG